MSAVTGIRLKINKALEKIARQLPLYELAPDRGDKQSFQIGFLLLWSASLADIRAKKKSRTTSYGSLKITNFLTLQSAHMWNYWMEVCTSQLVAQTDTRPVTSAAKLSNRFFVVQWIKHSGNVTGCRAERLNGILPRARLLREHMNETLNPSGE